MASELRADLRLPSDEEAAQLAAAVAAGPLPSVAAPLALLARWARQLSLRALHSASLSPTTSQQQQTLATAVAAACTVLATTGPAHPYGAASVLFLGSAAGAISSKKRVEEVAEAIGAALLGQSQSPVPLPTAAIEPLVLGTAALLPALAFQPDAACWLFAALLAALDTLEAAGERSSVVAEAAAAADALSFLYPAMRTATGALLVDEGSLLTARKRCLEGLYATLRAALLPVAGRPSGCAPTVPGGPGTAAAALAAGGMLESMVRARQNSLSPMIEGTAALLARAASGGAAMQAGAALAISQTYQVCRIPLATPVTLLCCLEALFTAALDVGPLLQRQNQDLFGFARHGTNLAAACTMQLVEVRLPPEPRATALAAVASAARRTHQQYQQHILNGSVAAMAGNVDQSRHIEALLQRQFISSVEVLAALQAPPATVISVAADLQFARVATPSYAPLLKSALEALPGDPASVEPVLAALPPYPALQAPSPALGGAPAWLADGITAAKVQLLFQALATCCTGLSHDAAATLAASAFLFLLHPHSATAAAAHGVLWSLMAASHDFADEFALYYVTRSLEGVPGDAPPEAAPSLEPRVQALGQGLAAAFGATEKASPTPVLCVRRVLGRAAELAAAGVCWDAPVLGLYNVAVQQLFSAHYSLETAISTEIEEFLKERCPPRLRGAAAETALAVVARSGDVVRKPGLAAWYQRWAATI